MPAIACMNGTVSTLRCAVRALLAIACVSLAHAAQADSPLRSINGAFPQARTAQPLSLAEESALHPLDHFKECETCPDRKSTRLNSSHLGISYAVFCLKKKINNC